jgi:integrase
MKILKFKKFKGLHIVCKGCSKQIEINQDEYKGCTHPLEKQKYKAIIHTKDGRRTKDLKALEYDDAIKELLDFKHELANSLILEKPHKTTSSTTKINHERFLDCIAMYGDYLENVDVPFFEQRPRTKEYIKDTIGYLDKFRIYLDNKGVNTEKLTIYQIDKKLIGDYFESLYKKSKSMATYNHNLGTYKSFYKFLIENRGYELINPVQFAKLKNVQPNPLNVEDNDFDKILNCIDEVNSVHTYPNGVKKKMYKPYLKDAFEIIAYTGMRNLESIIIKYSDIVLDENGELDYVRGIDLKFEKAHNYDKSKPVKYICIPITPELENLLIRLDYKNHLGEDRYLIGPDENISRESMNKQLTHSFKFFRDKAGITSKIALKHLRKTFLTKIQTQTGMVESLGYQKTLSVINKNYIVKPEVARSVREKGFRLFKEKAS